MLSKWYLIFTYMIFVISILNVLSVYKKSSSDEYKKRNQQTLFYILESFLRLLHPVMPFLSEELYQKLPKFENKYETVSLSDFPEPKDYLNDKEF